MYPVTVVEGNSTTAWPTRCGRDQKQSILYVCCIRWVDSGYRRDDKLWLCDIVYGPENKSQQLSCGTCYISYAIWWFIHLKFETNTDDGNSRELTSSFICIYLRLIISY